MMLTWQTIATLVLAIIPVCGVLIMTGMLLQKTSDLRLRVRTLEEVKDDHAGQLAVFGGDLKLLNGNLENLGKLIQGLGHQLEVHCPFKNEGR